MEKMTHRLIDSITVPLSASSPSRDIHPFSVTICCPPNGSTVGVNFTADGQYDLPDTGVQSCTLGSTSSGPIQNMSGNWSAPFSNLTPNPNPQTLTATGDHGGNDAHMEIIVSASGEAPLCMCVNASSNPKKDVAKPMVQTLTFQGQFPLDAYGKPKPLSLSFTGPATFSVGGPVIPPNRVIKCTLGHQVSEPLMLGGDRWTARFSNVPAGKHTLRVVAEDGTTDHHQIEISTTPRATEGGRASQEVAVS